MSDKWMTPHQSNKVGVTSKKVFGAFANRVRGYSESKFQFEDNPLIRYLGIDPEKKYSTYELYLLINASKKLYFNQGGEYAYNLMAFVKGENIEELVNDSMDDTFFIMKNNDENEVKFTLSFDTSNNGKVVVDWGDGTQSIGTNTFHRIYSSNNNDYITISKPTNGAEIKSFTLNSGECEADIGQFGKTNIETIILNTYDNFYGNLEDLPNSLVKFEAIHAGNSINGSINDLGENLSFFSLKGNGTLTGDFDKEIKFQNIEYFIIYPDNTITGDLSRFPDSLKYLIVNGQNTIYGNIADIPESSETFKIDGENTITGVLADIKTGIDNFSLDGQNTVTGNLSTVNDFGTYFTIAGNNSIDGSVSSIHGTPISINILGNNTLSGTLQGVPDSVRTLTIDGANVISGDIGHVNGNIENVTILGSNVLSGDIAGLTDNLKILYIRGGSTIHGDVKNLPSSLQEIYLFDSNTLSGDIADLPKTLKTVMIHGSNTLAGNLRDVSDITWKVSVTGLNTIQGDFTDIKPRLGFLNISGNHSIGDDLKDLPSTIYYFTYQGAGSPNITYTGGLALDNIYNFYFNPTTYGLNSSEIDQLLVDLDTNTGRFYGAFRVNLKGANASRTSASDVAVASLQAKGVILELN